MNFESFSFYAIGLMILLFISPSYSQAQTEKGYQSSNVKYQAIRIKHRVQRGFSNKGRVLYHYVTDSDVNNPELGEIGNVTLQHGEGIEQLDNGNLFVGSRSGVRKVHSAVSLNKAYHFKELARIGNITVLDSGIDVDGGETNVRVQAGIEVH